MHGDNVLSVTFKAYRRRFISDVPTMYGDDVSISAVLTKHGDNAFISDIQSLEDISSVTFQQCMDTTFYQ